MQSQRPPPDIQGPYTLEEIMRVLPRQYIKVLSRPSIAAFTEEMSKATWRLVWVQLLGWMTLLVICGLLILLIRALFLIFTASFDLVGLASTFALTLLLALIIPMLLLVNTVLVYLLARAFGGRGTLGVQSYTCLLFQIALSALVSILSFIPTIGIALGIFFGFGAFLYGLLLQIFAIIAVHRLDARSAVAAVFISAVITLLFISLLIAIISTILGLPIAMSFTKTDPFLMLA
jgi:hypothetical protein